MKGVKSKLLARILLVLILLCELLSMVFTTKNIQSAKGLWLGLALGSGLTTTTKTATTGHDINTPLNFEYNNPLHRFPLPLWLDNFLNSQPSETHHDMLLDPNEKFLVLTCHKYKKTKYEKCGGFTDRLFLLPYYIWLAHKTGRRLLIKYSKPFPLEEYLVPPDGGFDWRLPTKFVQNEWDQYANRSWTEYKNQRRAQWHKLIELPEHNNTRFIFTNANLAIPKVGKFFTTQTGEDLDILWPGIFRRMFSLSMPLSNSINKFAKINGLVPGEYAAAHVRARFPVGVGSIKMNTHKSEHSGINMDDNITASVVKIIADNSIKCAVKAMPGTKHVYFASDSSKVNKYLMDESPFWAPHQNKSHINSSTSFINNYNPNTTLVMRPGYTEYANHLENLPSEKSKVSDYNSMFFDLWIMAHSKCLAQGLGGFGHFGSVLSGNHLSCRVRHRNYGNNGATLPSCPTPYELKAIKARAKE